MTAVPVRHTQFASWIDPDAWMETMKGPRWNAVLDEEAAIIDKFKSLPEVKKRLTPFKKFYSSKPKKSIPFQSGPCTIEWHGQFFKTWSMGKETHEVRDLDTTATSVCCTQDIGDGAEDFQLQYWVDKKPSWTKHPVGPDVAILGDRIFYLGVKNKLQYHELYSCNLEGKDVKLHYKELKPTVNLALEKRANRELLLIKDDSQDVEIYQVHQNGYLQRKSGRFIIPSSWILPKNEYGIDFCWPSQGYLITKTHGQKTLWFCGTHKPRMIFTIDAGEILFDPWAVWEGRLPCIVSITQPDLGTTYANIYGETLTVVLKQKINLTTVRFEGRSSDSTVVHGIATHMKGSKPKKMLVIGYGAYGMPTSIGSVLGRWAPLLHSDWLIVHTFLRGGGDHTETWAKAGRRSGRMKTFADFKALIISAQEKFSISPSKTAIYGRSAGGLLMGEMLNQDSEGKLVHAIYAEVPYVDELRTTTNTDLPLTALEYNEFGAPSMRLEDFIHVVKTSPADSAAILKTPNTFVLTRTAEFDSQVFAYESVKWIRRLRANASLGAPKLCIVERKQGHFTPPELTVEQWATDCAFLDAWMCAKNVDL